MRKHILAAGIAAVVLLPSLAMAQQTCEQRANNRVAGTVVGAGLGAILGSAVAGHGDKGAGAVVGAVGGGIIGNQMSKGSRDCQHAYGYYDNEGRWHANRVAQAEASGYYDRNGAWIDGRPAGYYERDGMAIDRTANGYYDTRGVWVATSASSYGSDVSYETRDHTVAVDTRIARIAERIERSRSSGDLSYSEARRASTTLRDIRRYADKRRRHGGYRTRDEATLQARLDRLATDIRMNRRD